MYIFLILLLVALTAYFFLKKKISQTMTQQPVNYSSLLQTQVFYYQKLSDNEKTRFEKQLHVFLADTHIESN